MEIKTEANRTEYGEFLNINCIFDSINVDKN
jgi:hypothetical protein